VIVHGVITNCLKPIYFAQIYKSNGKKSMPIIWRKPAPGSWTG